MWGNTMKAKVNLQLLNTTRFDSGALGMLAMVVHPFVAVGHYHAVVMHLDQAVADVGFDVDEKSAVMQLDIDLAEVARQARAYPRGCGCKGHQQTGRVVSPQGYVLFHASAGYGYSVLVSNAAGEVAFNSTTLARGDLFAVSLLEPAAYALHETIDSLTGEITVSSTPDQAKHIKSLETRYVEVNHKTFDPACIDLVSAQGLVFRVNKSARIVIEKKSSPVQQMPKPGIHMRYEYKRATRTNG